MRRDTDLGRMGTDKKRIQKSVFSINRDISMGVRVCCAGFSFRRRGGEGFRMGKQVTHPGLLF